MDTFLITKLINNSDLYKKGGIKLLAKDMGINYTTLYSLSSGKNTNPKIDTLKTICDYFGVGFSQIFNSEVPTQTVHLNELSTQSVRMIENIKSAVSIQNKGVIDSLPYESILYFEQFKSLYHNNYYLCSNTSNQLTVRKAVEEDGKIIFISKNNIAYKAMTPILQLTAINIP